MSSDEKINAMIVLEAIGKPPEYLIDALNEIIQKIKEEKGVAVINSKVNVPVQIKDSPEFFSDFAELEIEVDNFIYLAVLVFKYMPAHIEISYPEELAVKNSQMNDLFNEIARRLHGYDEIARVLQLEKSVLEKKIKEANDSLKKKSKKNKVYNADIQTKRGA
jgi:hypothetical protein